MGDIVQNVTIYQPVRYLDSGAPAAGALWEQSLLDDIRRMREDIDRLARSNRLGHTSLKLGEGSLDVFDDQGRPAAGLGETSAGHGVAVADPDHAGALVGAPVLIERRRGQLQTRIQQEHEARISAVQQEAATRAAQDSNLSSRITNETAARQSADSNLGDRITSEANARAAQDSNLSSRITNETSAWNANKASVNSQLAAQEIRIAFLEANLGGGGDGGGGTSPY